MLLSKAFTKSLFTPSNIAATRSCSLLLRSFSSEIGSSEELKLSYLTGDKQGIAVIELNREKGKNSLNKSLLSKFQKSVEILQHDRTCRVVIIRSLVKGVFCAGADLKERQTLTQPEVAKFVTSLRQLFVNVENLPMPTIGELSVMSLRVLI